MTLAYLQRHGLRQRTAEYGEILGKHIHQTAVDRAVAGNHTVAEITFLILTEVGATMADKHVELIERTFVEKLCDTFTCGVFAFVVLFLDSLFTSTQTSFVAPGQLALVLFEADYSFT